MKESILILGAGLMQKPAILSAKELGLKVYVIDADDKAVSIPYADEFMKIDLKDKESILQYAQKLKENSNLVSVFTAGTDFSSSVSFVCEKLGFNAHSYIASQNATIKTQMRECFEKYNVPSPKFIKVSKENLSNKLLDDMLKIMDFPIVVKPVDNMGARGCRMIRSKIEFERSVETAIKCSRSGFAILEEYMEGPEFSIDSIVENGQMTITGFAQRHIYYPPYFIEVGHTMPAILDKKIHDELISVFSLGVKALGLTTGVAKADIKYTKKGPMIGEIAARLSGGYMSGWTFPYASDLNLTKQAILISCGRKPEELINKRINVDFKPSELCKNAVKPFDLFEVPCLRTSAERAWISIPGKVLNIENINDYTDKAVFDYLPRATVSFGSLVDFPRNNVEKCGNVISVSYQHDIAIEASENAVSNVFITLEKNNLATDNFLNKKVLNDEQDFPPSAFGFISDEQIDSISGFIEKDDSVLKNIPNFVKSADYINKRDWNYNTIEETARKFDILRPKHPVLDAKIFWKAVFRGGIQAAVYISDSTE